jgi:hypothetical protein
MADDKSESSAFKVVDRRSFTSEGSRREGEAAEVKSPAPAPPPEARIKTAAAPERPVRSQVIETPEADFGEEPSGFDTLVSYLSTTAMFQLGLIAGPGGERIPADMPNAQRTIDLLDVLQEKTQGNLTPKESRLLDDVLYELRMTFVELQKRQARQG